MNEIKTKVIRYFISCGVEDKEPLVRALACGVHSAMFYEYDVKTSEFSSSEHSLIFDFAKAYIDKYGEAPSKEVVLDELHENSTLTTTEKENVLNVLKGLANYKSVSNEVVYNVDRLKENYIYYRQLAIINQALNEVESKPKGTLNYLQKELSLLNVETFTGDDDKTQTYEGFIKDALLEFTESGQFDDTPIPFGFQKMDFTLGGMHPGEFLVIVGPTGAGKSFFAGEIVCRAGLDNKHKVVYANREMLPKQTLRRILARQTQVPSRKLRNTGALTIEERRMLTDYMQSVIDDSSNNLLLIPPARCVTVPMIKREIELFYGNNKPDLVVVDYLEELQPSKPQQSMWESVRFTAQELKNMAVELQCPVLTLAQLNAEGIKNPTKAELINLSYKDIAKKADGVFVLFPDKDSAPQPPMSGSYYGTPGVIHLKSLKYRNEASGVIYSFMAEFSTSSISECKEDSMGSTFGRKVLKNHVQSLEEILGEE